MTDAGDAVDQARNKKESKAAGGKVGAAGRDAETRKNYLLLRNYAQNILPMREVLLKTAMHSIDQVDSCEFPLGRFSGGEKIKVKSMFQMDVISGIMLYIEDLVVLSESFRRKILYHELLDPSGDSQSDVGKMIDGFFKSVGSFSDEEFRRILGYGDPGRMDLEDEERALVERVMQENIAELKRILAQIGEFGRTHHPAFRRFKHGGAPLIPGSEVQRGGGILSGFDSHTPVLEGADPFRDIIVIPLSKDVLEGYRVVIHGIKTCLDDLVKNHIICIERNLDGMIPTGSYSEDCLSGEETRLYVKIINEFYGKHPPHMDDLLHFHFESEIKREKIKWYLDLPNFLRECKRRSERVRDSS